MRKYVLILMVVACLGMMGCVQSQQPTLIPMTTAFNAEEARGQLEPGNNTIKGSAFLRQRGGGVVTCAGEEVRLTPQTNYADERMRNLYLSNERGFNPIRPGGQLERENASTDPDYVDLIQKTTANAHGEFAFKELKDGTYYITVPVHWMVGRGHHQGAVLMQRVEVSGEETKEIVMTGP